MTELLPVLYVYIPAWLEAPYSVTISAHSICGFWASPPESQRLIEMTSWVLIFPFLITPPLAPSLLPTSVSFKTLVLAQLPARLPINCQAIFSPAGVANLYRFDLIPYLAFFALFSIFGIPCRDE